MSKAKRMSRTSDKLPMRRTLKIVAILVVVFLVAPIAYSTFSGYTIWYFAASHSRLTADGRPAHGRVHRGNGGQTVFVTRTDGEKATTYLVQIPHGARGTVWSCGKWVAPRFPAFPIGDLNPACWTFKVAEEPDTGPIIPPRRLATGPNFVEFTADDGSRVRATW